MSHDFFIGFLVGVGVGVEFMAFLLIYFEWKSKRVKK